MFHWQCATIWKFLHSSAYCQSSWHFLWRFDNTSNTFHEALIAVSPIITWSYYTWVGEDRTGLNLWPARSEFLRSARSKCCSSWLLIALAFLLPCGSYRYILSEQKMHAYFSRTFDLPIRAHIWWQQPIWVHQGVSHVTTRDNTSSVCTSPMYISQTLQYSTLYPSAVDLPI